MRTTWLIAAVLLVPGVARAEFCKSYEWPTAGHPCFNAAVENDPPAHAGPMHFQVAFISRSFADVLSDGVGTVRHDGGTYMFKANGDGKDSAVGAQLKLTSYLGAGFYVGGDFELASVDPSMATITSVPGPTAQQPLITEDGAFMLGGDVALGFGGRIDQDVELGMEVASGVREVGYNFDSRLGTDADSTKVWANGVMLEARAHAAVWLTPTIDLNLFGGYSVLDDGHLIGVAIGIAGTPYGRG